MIRRHQKLALSGMIMLGLSTGFTSNVYAAKPIDLVNQNVSVLQSFMQSPTAAALKASATSTQGMVETKRTQGFNNTVHVRVQQTYSGYPVFGADAVIHIPNGTNTPKGLTSAISAAKSNKGSMSGKFYQDLHADLANAPAMIFQPAQAAKALHEMIKAHQTAAGLKADIVNPQSKLMVYFDKKTQKAHWVYKVAFVTGRSEKIGPAMPVYIVDAITFEVYRAWDNLQSANRETVGGVGNGGNEKKQYVYDGKDQLVIQRDAKRNTCYIQNDNVLVKSCSFTLPILYRCIWSSEASSSCKAGNAVSNNVYRVGDDDGVNGGFSPSNDALYNGKIIKSMYRDWYQTEVLTQEDGETPLRMDMTVHLNMENAYWDPNAQTMNFGDGGDRFFPLTSLGVTAHEISHGFTSQHSNLTYEQQSGGMNEAYSDMAAQAADAFATRPVLWQIGPEIVKGDGALRYMDEPGKDCAGRNGIPGEKCSLSKVSEYDAYVEKHKNDPAPSWSNPFDTRYPNVHYSSGIYNRFFYLLSTSEGWDVQTAFKVMLNANANYWTAESDFSDAACGVLKSATELGKDTTAIKAAFDKVEVKSSCSA